MKSSLSKSPLVGEKSMKESLVEVNSFPKFRKWSYLSEGYVSISPKVCKSKFGPRSLHNTSDVHYH